MWLLRGKEKTKWPSGVMAATPDLGSGAEMRESSSLSLVTVEWLVLNNKSKRKYKIGV